MTATLTFQLRSGVLVDEFPTSTQNKIYRVELPNGTHFQVNAGVYNLLGCCCSPLTLPELANAFEKRTGQPVAIEQLSPVVDRLKQNGIIIHPGQEPDAVAVPTNKLDTYLGLHFRRDLIPAKPLARVASPLSILFRPIVAAILLVVTAFVHLMFYYYVGIPPRIDVEAVSWPLLYIVMTGIMFWHELGHLAACHYHRCPHGPLGFALYMLNPAVYVNVTAAWRLPRYARGIVDAGGIYFQMIIAPILILFFWWTNDATFLLIFLLNDLVMLDNLEPFIKLDGYWLLSDLTGVPNLHTRTGEHFKYYVEHLRWRLGMQATPPQRSSFSQWSPNVHRIILGYTLVSLVIWPLLIIAVLPLLFQVFVSYPELWYTAVVSMGTAIRTGNFASMWIELQVLFLPTLMLANLGFLIKIGFDRRHNIRHTMLSG